MADVITSSDSPEQTHLSATHPVASLPAEPAPAANAPASEMNADEAHTVPAESDAQSLAVEETTPAGEPIPEHATVTPESVAAEESEPATEDSEPAAEESVPIAETLVADATPPLAELPPVETPTQAEQESVPEPEPSHKDKPARGKKAKTKAKVEEKPDAVAEPPVAAPTEGDSETKPEDLNKKWYVVKVQSGREESIKEAIERRVKIEGLEEYFGEILIPVEKEKVMVRGKRVERERKLFPGYIMARVEYNDQVLYLFRETSGVGDFVGGGPNQKPIPMSQREVDQIQGKRVVADRKPGVTASASPYSLGERVRVKEGVFSGMEGDIKEVLEAKEQVRVELFVLGRPVSVELDYWQVEPV